VALDIADQQILADLFERGVLGSKLTAKNSAATD
jgi:hypothetical protein